MTNTKEQTVWKTYPEYPFIEANQYGEIRTIDRDVTYKNGVKHHYKGHVLKQHLNNNGYMQVGVSVKGKKFSLSVHRIVATCFLPNPDGLPEVNHIDCDRTNNKVSNLEWCTTQENIAYRDKLGHTAKHNAPKKPVFAVNLKTLKTLCFESQHEAARQLGVDFRNINGVLKGRKKQIGGYWFCYADENAEEKIRAKFGEEVADKVKALLRDE